MKRLLLDMRAGILALGVAATCVVSGCDRKAENPSSAQQDAAADAALRSAQDNLATSAAHFGEAADQAARGLADKADVAGRKLAHDGRQAAADAADDLGAQASDAAADLRSKSH